MPKVCYVPKTFSADHQAIVDSANEIIEVYAAQGYDLTLRQLYYQFVSRDLITNRVQEYKRLGGIISDARRAGLIDWDAIVDRTRNLRGLSHWATPGDYIMPDGFTVNRWLDQKTRVEVWIEKDALAGVFERVCNEWDVPYFSCRGYTSDSEIWSAAQRLKRAARTGKEIVILHFGDHDPSGIDMTRDIRERIVLLGGPALDVRRLALNRDQVDEYDPPPNPAKETDSRFAGYLAEHGDKSWELDALEPAVLSALVETEVKSLIEKKPWAKATKAQEDGRAQLHQVADSWDDVVASLGATLEDDEDDEEDEGAE